MNRKKNFYSLKIHGKTVTCVGNSAFDFCDSLISITIPDSVTSIGNSAFESCKKLTDITIPGSVIIIGDHAFSGCNSLKNITIPCSVKSIGHGAFGDCRNFKDVYYKGTLAQWKKVKIDGDNENLESSNIHTLNVVSKSTSISKVISGKKEINRKIKKQILHTIGYQIQFSTNSKFTNAKTKIVKKEQYNIFNNKKSEVKEKVLCKSQNI